MRSWAASPRAAMAAPRTREAIPPAAAGDTPAAPWNRMASQRPRRARSYARRCGTGNSSRLLLPRAGPFPAAGFAGAAVSTAACRYRSSLTACPMSGRRWRRTIPTSPLRRPSWSLSLICRRVAPSSIPHLMGRSPRRRTCCCRFRAHHHSASSRARRRAGATSCPRAATPTSFACRLGLAPPGTSARCGPSPACVQTGSAEAPLAVALLAAGGGATRPSFLMGMPLPSESAEILGAGARGRQSSLGVRRSVRTWRTR